MIRNMTSEAFSNLRLFTCNSHPELAQEIAEHMGIELGKSTVTRFSDGETSVSIWESVRGKDCFIVEMPANEISAAENSLDIEMNSHDDGTYSLVLDYDPHCYSRKAMENFTSQVEKMATALQDGERRLSELL